jgi:hypothetical protein
MEGEKGNVCDRRKPEKKKKKKTRQEITKNASFGSRSFHTPKAPVNERK